MTYRVFIEKDAADAIASIRGRKRTKLRIFVASLASDPFNEGDFSEMDELGRQTFTKVIDDFALSYFPDHAAKEVKVFQVSKAEA